MNIGDWVTSHSTGIWQVYRILEYNGWDPSTGGTRPTTAMFSKRFLSPAFKRSFKEEVSSPPFVKPLAVDMIEKLENFIADNPKIHDAFQQYAPKPIHAVFNARIHREKMNAKEIDSAIPKDKTFTALEIQPFLEDLGFDTRQNSGAWTAQFVAEDHKCDDNGYLRYTFAAVLKS